MRTIRARAMVGVAVALWGGACAETPPPPPAQPAAAAAVALTKAAPTVPEGPPVTLLPAATARPLELVAISITSLDRLLTKGATLVGHAVPLPVDPSGLRDMLLSQAGLSSEIARNLDLQSPSGAAIVATGAPGATGVVMAVAARGAVEAERVIDALGKPVMKRGAVVLIDNGTGGKGWVFRAGNVVVLSDEIDALARGAMLALEARHATAEDVTAVIHPAAIAQANGTDVKTAVAALIEAIRSGQLAQQGGPGPVAGSTAFHEEVAQIVALLADIDTAEMGLVVDDAQGMVLRLRLHPTAGTTLANVARDKRPFELDKLLLSEKGTPGVVSGASYGPLSQKLMTLQRARIAAVVAQEKKQKNAGAALAFFDAQQAALAGQFSMVCTPAAATHDVWCELSEPLKDADAAGKVAAALAKLDAPAALALMKGLTGENRAYTFTAKRETVGKLKVLHYVQTPTKDATAETKKLLGRGWDWYVTVAQTRLLMVFGADAKARLTSLASRKPGSPSAAVASAMMASAGRDGFGYFDLAAVLGAVAAFPQVPKAEALAKAAAATSIPLHATMGGDGAGKVWSFDLTLPPAAFTGAGAVIQKMMAAGN